MTEPLQNLISYYDCLGWIPTIRGCLSLDLIDNAESILGDVDKYSVRFKKINGLHSTHYLIASSLLTVNDTKVIDYVRTFRYIFTGSINDEEQTNQELLTQGKLKDDADLKKYLKEEGLLVGHLTIVVEETNLLSDLEVSFLCSLQELSAKNEKFCKEFNVNAASMEILESYRSEMLQKWKALQHLAHKIETDEKNKRPTFCFSVVLTRDGILLLKDVSSEEYKKSYAAPGSADDYTQNIPIHRLFKMAMNYVKYLFHSNYHHNEDHDTYLPTSNLHPIKAFSPMNLDKVFRHQLDAFLVPVIKMKRNKFASFSIEPQGIIFYAKAFIRVFESHGLINDSVTKKAKDYCDILEKEVEHMTSRNNALANALLTQHNPFIIMSGMLAFVFTCLKLISIFVRIPQLSIRDIMNITDTNSSLLLFDIVVVMTLSIIGYLIYIIPRSLFLNKQFNPEKRRKNLLFRNSNLRRAEFSWQYKFYIHFSTVKLKIGKRQIYIIKNFAMLGLLVVSVIAMIFIIKH